MLRRTLEPDWLEVPVADGSLIRVRRCVHPQARRLRLTITPQGPRVTSPRGVSRRRALAFLVENADWLYRHLAALELDAAAVAPLIVGVEDHLSYRGRRLPLLWEPAPRATIEPHRDRVVVRLPRPWDDAALPHARRLLHELLERAVRRDVARWLPPLAEQLGRAPRGIRIRVLTSRWGSLGARDHMSLDLTLALAPPATLHYVLAHEMAHLMQRNHAPRFWRQVEALMPDYAPQRAWLSQHGTRLKVEMARLLGA